MAGETTTGVEILSAGIEFSIGGTVIHGCCATPDMGKTPEKKDVTSFDQRRYTKKAQGLMDVSEMKFEFWDQTTNYAAARATDSNPGNSYSLRFPDGTTYTWSGTHVAYKLAAQPGEFLKFAVDCTPDGDITDSVGGSSSNAQT